ncbi:hypothetical protein PHYSODRAFT_323592 [Phytophthora sojae]|uniref:Uncharacterized protein n=1 Tax=Phytophthora sojae (strain P6497) TaxID=1094619 RepID=G4YJP8_PHYSP|nr:hypothetical protein PHYSODRAFT_323592 [Phytophthora sojae]EGZ30160.1 hypothetical protein PHYSODRAFT_323592 [Phytophthora sojae]|eukprot:XP_009517435.1 hypothetical protein PHYSODRAFT_323592 [Phytophthora sojae]
MAASLLSRGSYLLVFPEDLNGSIASPVYAKISNARGTAVTALLDADGDEWGPTVKLPRATALARKVDSRDAEGEKLCAWVRQDVCAKIDGHFCYGQVTGPSESELIISTKSGPVETNKADICDSVYPVVAMVMGCHEFPLDSWSYDQLDEMHGAIMDRLLNPACTTARKRARVSLQHVINYVYYIDGGKNAPVDMESSFGSSFCDLNPTQPVGTSVGSSTRSRNDEGTATAAPDTTAFFDMTAVDDDAETAADEAVLAQALISNGTNGAANEGRLVPINRSQHTQPRPAGPAPEQQGQSGHVPCSAVPVVAERMITETSAEVEILDLMRMHKPHLLPHLMESRRVPATGAKRPAEKAEDRGTAKRSKISFAPTPEQRQVHDIVTSDAYKGKSPASCMDSMVSNAELLLWAYPGVAMRAYDLQFGSRGLSFLHFTPVDHLVRLKRQRESFVNMSDFSVSAKFLPASDPSSWDDILAGAIGFQQYCAVMCDVVTQQLATTLYNFIGALKSRNRWPQDMLLTLVLWIDSQLEQYRNAVAVDGVNGTATRNLISSRFIPDNLELHGLILTAQREKMEAMTRSAPCNTTRSDEQPRPPRPQRHGSNKGRKVPEDIPIPRQDGKEVCLKFLSKRGCPSSDPNVCDYASRVHFFPAALTEKLIGYIRHRFGGINSKYTST